MPVICEKPIADTLEAAKAMAAKAEETGLPCAIVQNYRYAPNKQEVVRIREEGRLGGCSTSLAATPVTIANTSRGARSATRHGF